jgi:cyclopropane fatty-acyl-phospholipid synthase-like methyltransferase
LADSENVCAAYDKIADWFDRTTQTRDLAEKKYLDSVLSYLKPGGRILDLGCGTGVPIAKFFIGHGMNITGVDGSSKMIGFCMERFPAMEWHEADMRTLDLGRTFNAVIAWDSFFHLTHAYQRKMFSIFQKHIVLGGILLFTSGHYEGEVISTMDGQDFYHASLDPEEYRTLLTHHGFKVLLHTVKDEECGEHTVWVAQRNL